MAKDDKKTDDKEIPHNFPDNVEPTEENVKAFKEQVEKDRKAQEEGKEPEAGARIGEGLGDPTVQPADPDHQPETRQTKTASK